VKIELAVSALALMATMLVPLPAVAQTDAVPAADDKDEPNEIVIIGSRRRQGSETDTPVPVDVIPIDKIATQGGRLDLGQALAALSPSYNSNRQTNSDAADTTDPAALRGLSPDQTLVLVNGKRRHTVSFVAIYGSRGRGSTGVDMNALPSLAVERIEVLRDGAAAQYGSDAIAGVINVVLKKRTGIEAVGGYNQYTRGDGGTYQIAVNGGAEVGDGGFVNVTIDYLNRGFVNRAPDSSVFTVGESPLINRTAYLNAELPIADDGAVYAVAGYQHRTGRSRNSFRRPGIDDPARLSLTMYPDGVRPLNKTTIDDADSSLGLRGKVAGWDADLSTTYGRNKSRYMPFMTLNASIANANALAGRPAVSASEFDSGGLAFRQVSGNLDVSRFFPDVLGGLNVAFGGEYRNEAFTIRAGEPDSYLDADGPGGGRAGAQGFPGFQPTDAGRHSRDSWAGYADAELNLTPSFLVTAAGRYEHYSDFGGTLNGKASFAWTVAKPLVLRGSISTGFRAPALQQRFYSQTFSDFTQGRAVIRLIAPADSPIARAINLPELRQEKSRNYTLGATWRPNDRLTFTIDGYWIDIKDRIALSGSFNSGDPTIGSILNGLDVDEAQFFFQCI
jgi:iron complex outermembrane recepter protein